MLIQPDSSQFIRHIKHGSRMAMASMPVQPDGLLLETCHANMAAPWQTCQSTWQLKVWNMPCCHLPWRSCSKHAGPTWRPAVWNMPHLAAPCLNHVTRTWRQIGLSSRSNLTWQLISKHAQQKMATWEGFIQHLVLQDAQNGKGKGNRGQPLPIGCNHRSRKSFVLCPGPCWWIRRTPPTLHPRMISDCRFRCKHRGVSRHDWIAESKKGHFSITGSLKTKEGLGPNVRAKMSGGHFGLRVDTGELQP